MATTSLVYKVTDSVLAVVNCHGQSCDLALGGGGTRCKSISYNIHRGKKANRRTACLFPFFFALKNDFRTCRAALLLSQLKTIFFQKTN